MTKRKYRVEKHFMDWFMVSGMASSEEQELFAFLVRWNLGSGYQCEFDRELGHVNIKVLETNLFLKGEEGKRLYDHITDTMNTMLN